MKFKRTFLLIFYIGLTCFLVYVARYLILTELVGKVLYNPRDFLFLTIVKNTGAAFGLFEGAGIALIILALIAVIWVIYHVFTCKFFISDTKLMYMAAFCAGILGNAYERFSYGFVLDYIKINLWNFPVFNINDILITIPAFLFIISILIQKKDEYFNDKEVEEDSELDM